jgi:hypothetical protein
VGISGAAGIVGLTMATITIRAMNTKNRPVSSQNDFTLNQEGSHILLPEEKCTIPVRKLEIPRTFLENDIQ